MRHETKAKILTDDRLEDYSVVVEFDLKSDEPEYFEVVSSESMGDAPDLDVKSIEKRIVKDFDQVGRIEDEILQKIDNLDVN